jgi:DNA-binding CsgD family transcriptional regulator
MAHQGPGSIRTVDELRRLADVLDHASEINRKTSELVTRCDPYGDPEHLDALAHEVTADVDKLDRLLREANSRIQSCIGRESHRTTGPQLTPREWQVAELIGQGCTNRQIANRLGIARRTAESHVENIMSKLGLSARSQIVAWLYGGTHDSHPNE